MVFNLFKKHNHNREALVNLGFELAEAYCAAEGEQFHPDYKKNRDLFRRLIKSETKTEKDMKKYLREASQRIVDQVDWFSYEQLRVKGSAVSDLIKVRWEAEKLYMKLFLTKSLVDAIVAGGESAEDDLKIPSGWTPGAIPVQEFLGKYVVKLSGNLAKTTEEKVTSAIKTSIAVGEDRDGAIKRLISVVDDPARAKMIAQTESVRAYTQGRLAVGHNVGAEGKRWDASPDACPICAGLESMGTVPIDDEFEPGISEPPDSHPHCRCRIGLVMRL